MTSSSSDARIVADIGGTHARFGWQASAGAPIDHVHSLACADFATLADAFEAYLRTAALPLPPNCSIGIATPVSGDSVRMTNHHWAFSQSGLRERLGLRRLLVINDFTALALAVPALPAEALRQVGGGAAVRGAAVGVIGPGTGLGVSGLLPRGDGDTVVPIEGEGGHVTLAAETDAEFRVLASVRRRHGHVSAERIVSGQGLLNLYRAICDVNGDYASAAASSADVTRLALAAGDAACVEAVQMFCGFLGSVAGNLALTLGARGGVYIGGGIVPRLGAWFDASPFRSRFEAKGRFRDYLASIPAFVIIAPTSPSLLGAARALDALAAAS